MLEELSGHRLSKGRILHLSCFPPRSDRFLQASLVSRLRSPPRGTIDPVLVDRRMACVDLWLSAIHFQSHFVGWLHTCMSFTRTGSPSFVSNWLSIIFPPSLLLNCTLIILPSLSEVHCVPSAYEIEPERRRSDSTATAFPPSASNLEPSRGEPQLTPGSREGAST